MLEIKNPAREYHSNETTVYSCQYHVIFTTKYRRRVLIDGVNERLKQLILDKQDEYHYHIIEQEVMPDHVHLLLDIDPTYKSGVTTAITRIKGYTSHTLREEYPWIKSRIPCLWTRSKFISTCGSISLETVKRYIETQKDR